MKCVLRTLTIALAVAAFCAGCRTVTKVTGIELPGTSTAAQLAGNGVAGMSIVIGTNASPRVRAAADDLAAILRRICGKPFDIIAGGDGSSGIVVGTTKDFPDLRCPVVPSSMLHGIVAAADGSQAATTNVAERLPSGGLEAREAYVLKSHPRGLVVLAVTDLGVENAVWDLLYRVGYRQFFPGAAWECVPSEPALTVDVDTLQVPHYLSRRIWYGYGAWDYAKEPYRIWCLHNRMQAGFELNTGHAYDGLIHRNETTFKEHPEFRGLVGGERKSSKLCIGNPDLRKFIVDYAVRQFAEKPSMDSISMDPSDGGGWCECERCKALGSVSDRALTLANAVAAAISAKYPGKYVGMYAYNQHSPPPNIRANPNVIISVATSFIKGGYTVEQLVKGWAGKGAKIGIREYYSVNTWDRDMPGSARGARLDYLAGTIPSFHRMGARFLSAESSDNWGPNGLGYWMAARMMWDTNEASRVDALRDDFLTRAFGGAKEPMSEFYRVIDGATRILVFDDRIGRMYRALDEAYRLANDLAIPARLNDLVLYCRYVELYDAYARAAKTSKQAAFEQLIRHAYRMRTTMMVHTYALYRDLASRDKSVSIPEGCGWQVPEGKNPWKSSQPYTDKALAQFVSDGIRAHSLTKLDFEPVPYSEDLVPAKTLGLATNLPAGKFPAGRGKRDFYTWLEAGSTLELRITGGLIAHYRDRGNVRVELWKIGGASETGERETLAAQDSSVPPDGAEHTIKLPAKEAGLHRLTVSDGHDMTKLAWPDGVPMTAVSTLDNQANLGSRWDLCFYVPKGTRAIGLFAEGEGQLVDPAGKVALTFAGKKAGFHSVPVPAGQDGAPWQFRNTAGTRALMTVPPCLARTPAELLLPREVVEAESR